MHDRVVVSVVYRYEIMLIADYYFCRHGVYSAYRVALAVVEIVDIALKEDLAHAAVTACDERTFFSRLYHGVEDSFNGKHGLCVFLYSVR